MLRLVRAVIEAIGQDTSDLPGMKAKPKSEELFGDIFFNYALQYYVAGRSAFFALSFPVAGLLFHHAVEMFLKSLLKERGYMARQLRDVFVHDLNKLWKEYKKLAQKPALGKYDNVVKDINLFERTRYPNKSYTCTTEFRKVAQRPGVTGPMTKGFTALYLKLGGY
jgi:hypothetical protein